MRDSKKADQLRIEAAKAVAPYLAPKLGAQYWNSIEGIADALYASLDSHRISNIFEYDVAYTAPGDSYSPVAKNTANNPLIN